MTNLLVRATDLNKVYRSNATPVRAVVNVSISIAAGEYVAICGRSGSGKSTLLHLLGLLAEPDSGHYELNGVDVSGLGDFNRAATRCALIGFVFQAPALLPRSSALENVELPLVYAGVPATERHRRAEDGAPEGRIGGPDGTFASATLGRRAAARLDCARDRQQSRAGPRRRTDRRLGQPERRRHARPVRRSEPRRPHPLHRHPCARGRGSRSTPHRSAGRRWSSTTRATQAAG